MENEVWVVFKNKVALGFFNETNEEPFADHTFNIDDPFSDQSIIEVLRAEKISKSYVKLKESSVLIPPINHGDIYQVEESEFPEEGLVINFNGFVEEEEEKEEKNLKDYLLSQHEKNINEINKLNGEFYVAKNKISNGSYKINITHNAKNSKDLLRLEKHFKKWGAFFQKGSSTLKGIGSVCFEIDNKFKKAVNCLETAPYVQGCFIAFDPSDYPDIEFSEDQIPGVEPDEE